MQMKKLSWLSMPVLDVRALKKPQLGKLADAYDRVASMDLQPLANLNEDPVRKEIDEVVSDALSLPDLKPIRELLAREPGWTGNPI